MGRTLRGLAGVAGRGHAGDVVDADAFGLLSGQRVAELDEQHSGLAVDQIDDRLVHRHGQVLGAARERVQLEEHGTLVDLADLLVHVDVRPVRTFARRVPPQKVHLAKHLLDWNKEIRLAQFWSHQNTLRLGGVA